MKNLISFVLFSAWITGIVLAKGFWSTFFAVLFSPWSFYLVIEFILRYTGLI